MGAENCKRIGKEGGRGAPPTSPHLPMNKLSRLVLLRVLSALVALHLTDSDEETKAVTDEGSNSRVVTQAGAALGRREAGGRKRGRRKGGSEEEFV